MSSATIETTMPESDRRMPPAVGIAIRNCARSRLFWFWLAMVGLYGPVLGMVGWNGPREGAKTLLLFGAYATSLLTLHLSSEQLTSYRMRLVPGYRRTHIAVLAITAAALLGGASAWFLVWMRIPAWAIGGWVALAFACGCFPLAASAADKWCSAASSAWGVAMLLWFLAPRFAWLEPVVRLTTTWQVNLLLLLFAAAMFARFVNRLWILDEDDPAYSFLRGLGRLRIVVQPQRARSAVPEERPISPGLPQMVVRLQEWRLRRALARGPAGFGWNARRWQLAGVARPTMLILAAMALLMTVLPWYFGTTGMLGFPQFMFSAFIVAELAQFNRDTRSAMFGFESLRPVTRADFFRQRGAGFLTSLSVRFALVAMVWTLWCIAGPGRNPPLAMVAWGAIEVAALFALVGALLWLRTFRSTKPEAIGVVIGTAVVGVGLISLTAPHPLPWAHDPAGLLLAALAIFAVGAALLWSAYRRWLVNDFE